jgi:hypothetical protein
MIGDRYMKKYKKTEQLAINREYKDRLFKFVFREKKDLLELYNAVNGTNYDNPEDIIVNTIENVVYLGMKNDTSFLFEEILNLYEHQSSYNPNMPLRGFFYFADLYRKDFGGNKDLYSSELIKLPTPQFIVFYNGRDKEPEEKILSLSDAFDSNVEACIECKARMLNINVGKNKELMEKSKRLSDYSLFIGRIRENQDNGMDIRAAVDKAMKDCISDGILEDILTKHQLEVRDVLLTEYNEELHIKNERKLAEARGQIEGERKFATLTLRLLEDGRKEDLLRATEDEEYKKTLYKEYGI